MKRLPFLMLPITAYFLCALWSGASANPPIQTMTAPVPPAGSEDGGFIPLWNSGDLPPFEPEPLPLMEPLPVRFDWRELGKVAPVKHQGSCGACYVFPPLASVQAQLLIAGEPAFDFSENNVKECDWWQVNRGYVGSCRGGNSFMVANFLSVNGTVLESCDPYVPANVDCIDTCPYIKTLLGLRVLSLENVPPPELLKPYLYFHGPIAVAMSADHGYGGWPQEFDDYDGSYTLHYAGSGTLDHAVLIIGWDDTLSHAGGQGAWIVQNSHGSEWGGTCGYGTERGYFTIAYGSALIGSYSFQFCELRDYSADEVVMHHDEAGPFKLIGYEGSNTAWGLCRFVPSDDMLLERVEIWSYDRLADLDIYVYGDFDGTDVMDLLTSSLDNTTFEAGYHSFCLPQPVPVQSGDDFYAVAKVTLNSQEFPLTCDDFSDLSPNSSYISPEGSSGSWTLLTDTDLGIRVRASRIMGAAGAEEAAAAVLSLECRPGPGGIAKLSYAIPSAGRVRLAVHDVHGRLVRTLVDRPEPAGSYTENWNGLSRQGSSAAPGVYFIRLEAGGQALTEKVVIMR